MPTFAEQAHAAVVEQVKREAPARLQADITTDGVEASINVTKARWTFTAYVKKAWERAWSAGARIERPLGLFRNNKA